MDPSNYLDQQIALVRQRAHDEFARFEDLVTIDLERYQAFKNELSRRSVQPVSDILSEYDQRLSPERRLGLNLFFGVVNYCFVQPYTRLEYSYHSKDGRLVKRATGFYTAMAESGLAWELLESIVRVSIDEWHSLLQTDRESDLFQIDDRLFRLQRFSSYLSGKGLLNAGRLFDLMPDAGSLLKLFIESGLFEDDLLKRAQLTVYMLNPSSRELPGREIPGLDRFTVMADYRLPQVCYNQGVLKILDPHLIKTLQSHQVVEPGSPSERALRAGTIVLGERLAGELGIAESDLDHLLWELSQVLIRTGKMTIPHMLVPTDKY